MIKQINCVSYKEALPPEKHGDMELFLKRLCHAHNAKPKCREIDIGRFVSEYRFLLSGRRGAGQIHITTQEKESALRRHKEGESVREIARDMLRCEITVSRILKEGVGK